MCEEKIPTGMEQVAGKSSWCSKVANVHLTKHTVALVYTCVSAQLVSHRPIVHHADNRQTEVKPSWYDAGRENTSERNESHHHYPK
jgi:hypothetical protein